MKSQDRKINRRQLQVGLCVKPQHCFVSVEMGQLHKVGNGFLRFVYLFFYLQNFLFLVTVLPLLDCGFNY